MKRTFSFFTQTLMVLSLLFVVGCDPSGTIPGVNQPPTCSITNPQANAQFNFDESVPVTVVAEDSDGTIAEVQLYIDNVGHSLKTEFPYNFVINAGEMSVGTHILKAVAKDNSGAKAETTVSITINPPNTESPDFVTFSNGQIPNTWHTATWVVDNIDGYDDIYSLRSMTPGVVVTSKTGNSDINFVEFYVKGNPVAFFIDGALKGSCYLPGSWKKFEFHLSEGLHTLKWENSFDTRIDAIRFKHKDIHLVGDYYQGGIVAYVDNTYEHGLIAAPYDQSEGIQWYNGSYVSIDASDTSIGKGQFNTTRIIQAQGAGSYAAKICDNLVLNGYDDWFLPNRDELLELYYKRNIIGGFDSSANYWISCSLIGYNYDALCLDFSNGALSWQDRSMQYRVRAVRYF